uniref:RRM domain-containing protein n=1 Tax=Panagrolaimus davidi TaxID=227884 RepID=A0A914Q9E9_9BILA
MHPVQIKIVKRSKGNPYLFVNQYRYYYNKKRKTKHHWQCMNNWNFKCKGTAITNSIQTNAVLIGGNSDHTCIPHLQSTIPMSTTPTSMPYYSDPTAAASDALTTSVSAAATPSVSSLNDSGDPKARVFVGNLNEVYVSREDLVGLFKFCGNVLGVTLSKGHALIQYSSQTEAELSVQILNGYTWEGSELVVKILTLYSTNDAIDRSNVSTKIHMSSNNTGTINGGDNAKMVIIN